MLILAARKEKCVPISGISVVERKVKRAGNKSGAQEVEPRYRRGYINYSRSRRRCCSLGGKSRLSNAKQRTILGTQAHLRAIPTT